MRYLLALKYRTGSIDSIRLLLQKRDCEFIDEDTIISTTYSSPIRTTNNSIEKYINLYFKEGLVDGK